MDYLSVPEMPWALWASQWLAYSAIYFLYEDFLCSAVRIAKKDPKYRGFPPEKLATDFAQLFGQSFADECLNDRPVRIARLARNAIAHNGGRETELLKSEQHPIRVINNYLQIYPEDVRGLFNHLKGLVLKLADAAANLPEFRGVP